MNESECNCLECQQIRLASLEWDTYVPTTSLQKRMLEVVKRIEDREKEKKKKRKVHPN